MLLLLDVATATTSSSRLELIYLFGQRAQKLFSKWVLIHLLSSF